MKTIIDIVLTKFCDIPIGEEFNSYKDLTGLTWKKITKQEAEISNIAEGLFLSRGVRKELDDDWRFWWIKYSDEEVIP